SEYLRDRTGNRRYWPVRCGEHIDVTSLQRDRDQLWAEALARFRDGTTWHLTQEEAALAHEEQEERLQLTETEETVRAYLSTVTANEVTVAEVLKLGMGFEPGRNYSDMARKHGAEVADAMKRFGWAKFRRAGGRDGRRTIYMRVSAKSPKT